MRPQDWPERLASFLAARQGTPFAWGQHDCCLFACDWLQTLTGTDPAQMLGLRGTYNDIEGAVATLSGFGGIGGVAAAGAEYVGATEIPPAQARRGDVVVVKRSTEQLGICMGATAAVASKQGWTPLPMALATRAWRV